jgi:hypothetical protein
MHPVNVITELNDNIISIDFMHHKKLIYEVNTRQVKFADSRMNTICTMKQITIPATSSIVTTKFNGETHTDKTYIATINCPGSLTLTGVPLIKIKTMDWAGEITDLFHYGNKEAIHQAVQGLRTRYNGEVNATILLDQLDQLQTQDPHWAFTSTAAMIRTAICIFTMGICLWKCCRQTKEYPTPRPSAPPMPMPVTMTQPATAPRTVPIPAQKTNNNKRATRGNIAIT